MWFNSMRLSRWSHSLLRAPLFALFLVASSIAGSQIAWAQSSPQTATQPAAQLPPAWNDAVARLASKIGSVAGPQKTISLTVKNISSLTDADMTAISQALKAELTRLGFALENESSAETQAEVTFSEAEEGYIWVADLRRGSTEQLEIVAAPKGEEVPRSEPSTMLVLERKLVWQQVTSFLDFAVQTNPVGFSSGFVILEPKRLVFYSSADLRNWRTSQVVAIPSPKPRPRDIFGSIDEQNGNAYLGPAGFVFRPNVRCTGGFDYPQRVQCSSWSDNRLVLTVHPRVPAHEQSDSVLLWDRCGDNSVVLATGNGDWTQPDTIQGYLVSTPTGVAVPSGTAIAFDGPVTALQREGRENEARVVVHNLKAGKYEGYLVTATCGN
jgi:hypothetical protein